MSDKTDNRFYREPAPEQMLSDALWENAEHSALFGHCGGCNRELPYKTGGDGMHIVSAGYCTGCGVLTVWEVIETEMRGYDDILAVLDSLPVIVRETRRRKGLSIRGAAKQVGVSFSTLARLESGDRGANLASVAAVLRWAAS